LRNIAGSAAVVAPTIVNSLPIDMSTLTAIYLSLI